MFVFYLLFILFLSSASAADHATSYSHLWGGFSTSLVARSSAQRSNVARAALDLDGTILPPGALFSFNELVGARDSMKGYRPAPMINERGGLTDIPGGGICQLATTIYNAALKAGLVIVERHPHSRQVSYVPPGRDATILSWRKDLKLRNPHSYPLLLRLEVSENRLTAGFWSLVDKPFQVKILSDVQAVDPQSLVANAVGQSELPSQAGGKGFSVVTRRLLIRDGVATKDVLSRDFYPPPSKIMGQQDP